MCSPWRSCGARAPWAVLSGAACRPSCWSRSRATSHSPASRGSPSLPSTARQPGRARGRTCGLSRCAAPVVRSPPRRSDAAAQPAWLLAGARAGERVRQRGRGAVRPSLAPCWPQPQPCRGPGLPPQQPQHAAWPDTVQAQPVAAGQVGPWPHAGQRPQPARCAEQGAGPPARACADSAPTSGTSAQCDPPAAGPQAPGRSPGATQADGRL